MGSKVRVVRRSSLNVSIFSPVCPSQGSEFSSADPRLPAGGFVQVQAFGKINLFLDVLGKRVDGYHDIVSVMQSVDLCDDLVIRCGSDNVRLFCDNPLLPTDERNLVVRAATVLMREFNICEGVEIELSKRIPMGAGLAGGSADCAATLVGMNELFGLNIPQSKLLEIGKALGADVPFCLTGGTVLTKGIGEKITTLEPHPPCLIVVACPDIHVSTGEIFSRLNATRCRSKIELGSTSQFYDTDLILSAISKKNLRQISGSLYNVFTPITAGLHPEIADIILQFKKLGALGSEMSGTGSSVFAYFDNEKSSVMAYNRMKELVKDVFVCKPVWVLPRKGKCS